MLEYEVFDYPDTLSDDTAANLTAKIITAISNGAKAVALDMRGVDFIYSIGIRTLISSYKAVLAKNTPFGLLNTSNGVKKALELVNVSKKMELYDSEEDFKNAIS